MIIPSSLGQSPVQSHITGAQALHYCYIDFGSSAVMDPAGPQVIKFGGGALLTAPEVDEFRRHRDGAGYDPFPVDIWLLGWLIARQIIAVSLYIGSQANH